jgi:sugar-specific transcriptional regulator TrmB
MARLRDIGLSEYESRAYRVLLDTGPTTAKELSGASDVPMGRIYDVLNGLEQHNLVRSQASSRPKKYIAVEPDTALERLLADKKRELEEKAERYERIVEELSEELDAENLVEGQFWTAAVGKEESTNLLLERLAAADERIVAVASEELSGLDVAEVGIRVAEELANALDRGVSIDLLMTPSLVDALPESVGERYRESLSTHPACSVRTTTDITGAFNLIDDAELVIQVPNPLESGGALGMIDLKDPEFAAEVAAEVRPRWEQAEALSI